MGLNNEYSDDVYDLDTLLESSDDESDEDLVLDPESWNDWYSEHLLNMWMGLRAYLEDNHLQHTLLVNVSFHDFCEFVRRNSL